MYAYNDLRHTIRTAEQAVLAAAELIDRYVTPERGDLTRAETRKAARRAQRRLSVAIHVARAALQEAGPASESVFRECVEELQHADGQFINAVESIETIRFKPNERCADACSALVCTLVALRDAMKYARRGSRLAKGDPAQMSYWIQAQREFYPALAS